MKDTTLEDKISNVTTDSPWLRLAYLFSAAISAAAYLYVYTVSPISMLDLFFKNLADPYRGTKLVRCHEYDVEYDELFCFLAGDVWILLSFGDLKRVRRLERVVLVLITSSVLLGRGVVMAVMWWRKGPGGEEKCVRSAMRGDVVSKICGVG